MAELVNLITNRIATYSTQKTAPKDTASKSSGKTDTVNADTVKNEELDKSSSGVTDMTSEDIERVKEAIKKGNESEIMANAELSYSVDDRTDTIVVKVIDKKSGDVIRQIPPKEFLNISVRLEEQKGAIVNEKG